MNKQEFRDVLCLRYGWKLANIPSHRMCGTSFSVDHAMICRHGGLTGFSIPMHQVIIRRGLLPFFVNMSSRRSENMGIVYVMLTVNLSSHSLFIQLLVVWARRLLFSTTVWQIYYHRSTIPLTARHSPGCAVFYHFHYYIPLYWPFMGAESCSQERELPAVSTELRLVESCTLID